MQRNKNNGASVQAQRREIRGPLQGQTLSGREFLKSTAGDVISVLPQVNVLKIGGQSIMDRGRAAVYPILKEIVANKGLHQLLLCVGGGTRARHAYQIALDLDLPAGVLSALGEATPRQNARMLQMLLAKEGGVFITTEDFEKLPLYLSMGCIPIMSGMPPYAYWEKPPEVGRIPANRTDSGTFLTAEFLGARSLIYIKDVEGLYTDDPKKNPRARFIPQISVAELLRLDLQDLVVERVVLHYMLHAQHIHQIHVINGLKEGYITRALEGEHVGTIIYG